MFIHLRHIHSINAPSPSAPTTTFNNDLERDVLACKSTIKLNNGISMPRIHLGVYMTSGNETSKAVTHALEAGYRGFDSAEWYANEREVGSAITSYLSSSAE
jgi:hypothetical protein